VSAPVAHQTGRQLSLDFRAATALFGSFGIEWDLGSASDDELDQLAGWVARYRDLRGLLHSGRMVRPESADPAVLLHGVVAHDGSDAVLAHVQLDESAHNRGVWVRVPGLVPEAEYELTWEGPVAKHSTSKSVRPFEEGPTAGVGLSGADLAVRGFWLPRMRPATATLVRLRAVSPA
jgi:alpha-galactosidase